MSLQDVISALTNNYKVITTYNGLNVYEYTHSSRAIKDDSVCPYCRSPIVDYGIVIMDSGWLYHEVECGVCVASGIVGIISLTGQTSERLVRCGATQTAEDDTI